MSLDTLNNETLYQMGPFMPCPPPVVLDKRQVQLKTDTCAVSRERGWAIICPLSSKGGWLDISDKIFVSRKTV